MADITDIERLNYYEGEYLGAVDFEAEQEYHRDMRRRHNIGPHTWGIVTGLDISQFLNGGPNNEVDVYVQPGMAVDGFGREIVVFSPYQVTADMFADFPAKQTLSVWIGYAQQMINPDSDQCASAGQTNAYSRVQEGFQIVISPIPPTSDPVVVGGNDVSPPSTTGWTQPATLPPLPSAEGDVVVAFDDSVPFQELPDDNTTANWLVELGQVLWDGPNQRLLQSAAATANLHREYAGSVAATIYAPAGTLTIQDRSTPSPYNSSYTGVAVEVQGALTVDAQLTAQEDVWLNGGNSYALYFKDAGSDGDTQLYLQRLDGATGGADLHIHIGDNADAQNKPQRLTVGYGTTTGNNDTNVFTVSAAGNVTIPAGSLSFGTQQAQILNLSGTNYGIGVQPDTLYFRSASDFAWYVNGTYVATQDNAGPGGSVSMLLNSSGNMALNGALAIDTANANIGQVNPGITFGNASGEGIASKRTAGGNQYGLDLYTGFSLRMSITNAGDVGIGTNSPDAQLTLGGGEWNLSSTEGDFKIGNATYRMKMGVALGGAGAGDARIRATGGTNRLLLGTGSGNDVLTIAGSNVGIGTITPGATLDVTGNGAFSGSLEVGTGLTVSTGGVAVSTGGLTVSSGGITISSGGLTVSSGNVTFNGNLHVLGSKTGYVVDQFIHRGKRQLERGDVVVLHAQAAKVFYGVEGRIPLVEVAQSTKSNDPRVCGVVDEPSLGADETSSLDPKELGNGSVGQMVTLGAYAYCKVNADSAPIESGDLLTTSDTPGHAQKADPANGVVAGSVIGKALGSLKKGKGRIPILISHQ
jgi:hypothetical protein